MRHINFGDVYFLENYLKKTNLKGLLQSLSRESETFLALLYFCVLNFHMPFDLLSGWIKGNYAQFLFSESVLSFPRLKEVFQTLNTGEISQDFFARWTNYILQNIDSSNDLIVDVISLSEKLEDRFDLLGLYEENPKATLLLVSQASSHILLFYDLIEKEETGDEKFKTLLEQAFSFGLRPEEMLIYDQTLQPGKEMVLKDGTICQLDWIQSIQNEFNLSDFLEAHREIASLYHLQEYRGHHLYLKEMKELEEIQKDPQSFLYAGLDLTFFAQTEDFLFEMALNNTFGLNEMKEALAFNQAIGILSTKELPALQIAPLHIYHSLWQKVFSGLVLFNPAQNFDSSIKSLRFSLLFIFISNAIKSLIQYQLNCSSEDLDQILYSLQYQYAGIGRKYLNIEPAEEQEQKLYDFFEIPVPSKLSLASFEKTVD